MVRWSVTAHAIPSVALSKTAMKPSPRVFTSRPWWTARTLRTLAKWRPRMASAVADETRAIVSVEPTRSVNRTVAVRELIMYRRSHP